MKKDEEMLDAFVRDLWRRLNEYRGSLDVNKLLQPTLGLLYLKKISLLEDTIHSSQFNLKLEHKEEKFECLDPLIEFAQSNAENNRVTLELAKTIDGYSLAKKEYGQLTEKLLAVYTNKVGKHSDIYVTPKEVIQLMLNFLSNKKSRTIYNPFGGIGSFAISDELQSHYTIEEIDPAIKNLCLLRLLLNDKYDRVNLSVNDNIVNWNKRKLLYDAVISFPPFGLKINYDSEEFQILGRNVESYIIKKSIESIKEDGKCIIAVPHSFLFNGGKIEKFRKHLLEENLIETIISMPNMLLNYTSIPFNILVINKDRINSKKGVRFIDASEYYFSTSKAHKSLDNIGIVDVIKNGGESNIDRFISVDEIRHQNYNLNTSRYFTDLLFQDKKIEQIMPLKKVLKPIQLLRSNIANEGRMVGIKDLSDSYIQAKRDFEGIDITRLKRNYGELKVEALLIASIGNRLKPTYFKGKQTVFINQNIYAYSVNNNLVDLDYLIIELRKQYVIEQLQNGVKGTLTPRISKSVLNEIKIEVPPLEQQIEQVASYKNDLIIKERLKFQTLQSDIGLEVADANSYLTHQIAGPLKNLRASFGAIDELLLDLEMNEIPNLLDRKNNSLSKTTYRKHMDIIKRDISSITQLVVNSKKVDLHKGYNFEEFDIIHFIKAYAIEINERELENGIQVKSDVDVDLLNVEYNAVNIRGDKKQLRHAFDNLIENAITHGFKNYEGSKEIEIVIYIFDEDKTVHIYVSNTGNPFPPNYTIEDYVRKGSKAGKSGGTGFGGFYVNEIIKRHGGELTFAHVEEADLNEMVTTLSIELNVENFDYHE